MRTKQDTTTASASQKLRVETYDLPSYWASYLINGDESGIEGKDQYEADKFLAEHNLPAPVSCEPAGIGRFNGLQCDLETYSFLIEASARQKVAPDEKLAHAFDERLQIAVTTSAPETRTVKGYVGGKQVIPKPEKEVQLASSPVETRSKRRIELVVMNHSEDKSNRCNIDEAYAHQQAELDKRTIPAEKPTDAPNYNVETELRAQAAQLAEAINNALCALVDPTGDELAEQILNNALDAYEAAR